MHFEEDLINKYNYDCVYRQLTTRPKWRLDGLLCLVGLSFVFTCQICLCYRHNLVRRLVSNILIKPYDFHLKISIKSSDA